MKQATTFYPKTKSVVYLMFVFLACVLQSCFLRICASIQGIIGIAFVCLVHVDMLSYTLLYQPISHDTIDLCRC